MALSKNKVGHVVEMTKDDLVDLGIPFRADYRECFWETREELRMLLDHQCFHPCAG